MHHRVDLFCSRRSIASNVGVGSRARNVGAAHQLPLAPPPDELPPPELLLNEELLSDEDEDEYEEEEKNELSLLSESCGITRLVVSVWPQCVQCSVIVSRPLRKLVGDRTRLTVVLSVTKPQAGHFEWEVKNAPYLSLVTCGQVGQVQTS
jgi:hypothetical protein